ncbi:uncharacterized protein [Centruroides vittatus]|uniref:uncharacterized protein isoform X1 n=1 Tax=Centruroides vittatus TaxID=120091 RepID=UPI0035106706
MKRKRTKPSSNKTNEDSSNTNNNNKQSLQSKEEKNETDFIKSNVNVQVKPSFIKTFFLYIFDLKCWLLGLIIIPLLNYAALKYENREFKLSGEFHDFNWQQTMYISCLGKGLPTVIMDSSTGTTSDIWIPVQKELSKLTQVCIYDRHGLGFSRQRLQNVNNVSDSYVIKRFGQLSTVERMVDDLHHLVTVSKPLPRPFILVGSELGALNVRFYTQLYERDVSDIVLVYPLVENLFHQDDGIWHNYWYSDLISSILKLQLSAFAGISRMGLLLGFMDVPIKGEHIVEDIIIRQKHFLCNPHHLGAALDEHYFMNYSFSQMKTIWKLKPFPVNVSVTVINGKFYDKTLQPDLNKAWEKSQHHLIGNLHNGCNHISVADADHDITFKEPWIIIESVKKLILGWRKK